jgi:hypothetical protein
MSLNISRESCRGVILAGWTKTDERPTSRQEDILVAFNYMFLCLKLVLFAA